MAEATDGDARAGSPRLAPGAGHAGPDEDVAAELERSAGRAQARGGLAAAAAFLGRAADLTVEPARRAERMLAAAQANLQAGAFDAALGLLAAAQAGPLDELGRARVDLLQAEVAYAQNRGGDAPPLLLRAARTLETLDVRLARDTYLDAWGAALFAGRLASAGGLLEVSRAVAAAPGAADPPRPCDLLLDGFALVFTEGRAAAAPVLQRAATGVRRERGLRRGGAPLGLAGDGGGRLPVGLRHLPRGRHPRRSSSPATRGRSRSSPSSVNVLGQAVALGGDFATAALLIAEADAVREATGTRVGPYGALVLAALRGREAEASELIEATIEEATAGGQGTAVQYAHWANAVVMNGLGRYEEALAAAIEASDDTPELFVSMWALSELIEAACRTQDTELAAARCSGWASTRARARPSGRSASRRAGARLLSEGEAAERLYREAIDRLARTRLRPELARSRLLYGEWLRREGRRVDAREQLQAAHDAFVVDGRGRVRRARPARAAGHGREGAQAHRRGPRRAHAPGAADREAGPRGPDESPDRRGALPQPPHRRVAPEQGVHQARDQLPPGPS